MSTHNSSTPTTLPETATDYCHRMRDWRCRAYPAELHRARYAAMRAVRVVEVTDGVCFYMRPVLPAATAATELALFVTEGPGQDLSGVGRGPVLLQCRILEPYSGGSPDHATLTVPGRRATIVEPQS